MKMSDEVPRTIARAKIRCGSIASPAENVTYYHPSYAQRTPIIPRPMPERRAGVIDSGHIAAAPPDGARRAAMSTTLIASSAPTLIAVLQFCTSALRRVLRTLMAATLASSATDAAFRACRASATYSCRYDGAATASVAADPGAITRKNVHP